MARLSLQKYYLLIFGFFLTSAIVFVIMANRFRRPHNYVFIGALTASKSMVATPQYFAERENLVLDTCERNIKAHSQHTAASDTDAAAAAVADAANAAAAVDAAVASAAASPPARLSQYKIFAWKGIVRMVSGFTQFVN